MLINHDARQQGDGYLNKTPIFQFILLSILFPMWGVAASLNDILITQFKTVFTLSDLATAFVQSAFYGGYFLIAIPASLVIRRSTYKLAIMIGLLCYIVGCLLFFPASHMATYGVFLLALFAIAIGLSFLETSANTYSSMIGPKAHSTLRLNISQTFYPIGSIAGILLGKYLVFGDGEALHKQAAGLTPEEHKAFAAELLQKTLLPYTYIIVVLVVVMIVFALTKYPTCKPLADPTHVAKAKISETLRYLARNGNFRKGIFAQFLYVGMQTAVWSFTIRLALNLDDTLNERNASTFMIFSFVAFFLGKFIANLLMARWDPNAVLIGYSVLGVISLAYVVFVPNMSAVWAAIVASGLFGPCWATIYSRTLDTIADKRHTETGGAAIVMSIIGGAVVPVIQGFVSDLTGSMQFAFLVSMVCFAAVLVFFVDQYRRTGRDIVTEEREALV